MPCLLLAGLQGASEAEMAHDDSASGQLGEDFRAQMLSALAELLQSVPQEDTDSQFRSAPDFEPSQHVGLSLSASTVLKEHLSIPGIS